ncbi:MAG: hypothetical protein ACR5K2_01145 [Wolbachia sp.]
MIVNITWMDFGLSVHQRCHIDAYFSLTDSPEPPFGYSAEDVIDSWSSVAGYDYFYDYSKCVSKMESITTVDIHGKHR